MDAYQAKGKQKREMKEAMAVKNDNLATTDQRDIRDIKMLRIGAVGSKKQ